MASFELSKREHFFPLEPNPNFTGMLWMYILQSFGVTCSYTQCVSIKWLDNLQNGWKEGNWKGHVFITIRLEGQSITICSTSARVVERVERSGEFRIFDVDFVQLFEGSGSEEFHASTQAGMNTLLEPFVKKWEDSK